MLGRSVPQSETPDLPFNNYFRQNFTKSRRETPENPQQKHERAAEVAATVVGDVFSRSGRCTPRDLDYFMLHIAGAELKAKTTVFA